jgi:chemotaxis protein CheY-P-specific phosphatase CheC
MMNDNDILIKVCCDVFESLSFMFGEAIDLDEVDSESESFINVSISYKGDRAGAIILIVSSQTAKSLAYNILGIDEDDEDLPFESSIDALKELLNTICGQFITSRFGVEPVFDLTVPETKIISLDEWQGSVDSGNFLALDVEDEPILIKSIIE